MNRQPHLSAMAVTMTTPQAHAVDHSTIAQHFSSRRRTTDPLLAPSNTFPERPTVKDVCMCHDCDVPCSVYACKVTSVHFTDKHTPLPADMDTHATVQRQQEHAVVLLAFLDYACRIHSCPTGRVPSEFHGPRLRRLRQ